MNELIIHYHLTDNKHEINAKTLNACEAKVLAVIEHISSVLGIKDELEVNLVIRTEGGIRDKIKCLIKKHAGSIATSIAIGVTINLISHYLTSSEQPCIEYINTHKADTDRALATLQQISNQQNDATQEQIKILQNINSGLNRLYNEEDIYNEIKKKRSDLYKTMSTDNEVEAFSIEDINPETKEYEEKIKVTRDRFSTFVLDTTDLPPLIDRDATVAIISPVLNSNGRYKWRGEYKGEIIDFYMCDNDFKELILSNKVKFGANDLLSGVLRATRKINELGEEDITNYYIDTVFGFEHNDGSYTETVRGYRERLRAQYPQDPTALYMDFEDKPE